MARYKKIVYLDIFYNNGKKLKEGEVICEVTLNEKEAKILNDTPTITGCKYELIQEKPKKQTRAKTEIKTEEK